MNNESELGSPPSEVARRRPRRSVGFIVSIVVLSALALIGLIAGFAAVRAENRARLGEAMVPCDAIIDREGDGTVIREWRRSCEESARRTTAVVIGSGVVLIAVAVAIVVLRRRIGERLGRLPDVSVHRAPDAN